MGSQATIKLAGAVRTRPPDYEEGISLADHVSRVIHKIKLRVKLGGRTRCAICAGSRPCSRDVLHVCTLGTLPAEMNFSPSVSP